MTLMQWGNITRRLRIFLRRRWWPQVIIILAIWALCDLAARRLALPIPGGVIGLGALLLALETRLVSVRLFHRGAAGLLTHLILFFVPAMLAVVNHRELLSLTGLKLLTAVFLGTPLVMLGTAAVVEIAYRREASRAR